MVDRAAATALWLRMMLPRLRDVASVHANTDDPQVTRIEVQFTDGQGVEVLVQEA